MLKVRNVLLGRTAGTGAITAMIVLIVSAAFGRAQTAADTVPEWQKVAGVKLSFDVASIKPADPAAKFIGVLQSPGLNTIFSATNLRHIGSRLRKLSNVSFLTFKSDETRSIVIVTS